MKSVLIIEDHELNMKLLKESLSRRSYNVLEARSGKKGIEIAAASTPDLVLMDINMPDINGVDVLKEIRSLPTMANKPVIAVTAYVMYGDKERFLKEGFDDFIPKPVDLIMLFEKVKQYLD